MEDTVKFKSVLKKLRIDGIHAENPINCIEIANEDLLFTCSDDQLIAYNLTTSAKQSLFNQPATSNSHNTDSDEDEFNCLKYSPHQGHLFASQGSKLYIYDTNTSKQIDKFKFFKETINAIELNEIKSIVACCDDSGKINLLDLRISPQTKQPSLTLKKSLSVHSNICSSLKFNPSNEHELFSGSFDCSFIKWDIRFTKSSGKQQLYVKKVDIGESLSSISKLSDENALISSMTPCFIHR